MYAILLGWPGDGKQVNLSAVVTSRSSVGPGQVFTPIGGSAISLPFTQDGSGLRVTLQYTENVRLGARRRNESPPPRTAYRPLDQSGPMGSPLPICASSP